MIFIKVNIFAIC